MVRKDIKISRVALYLCKVTTNLHTVAKILKKLQMNVNQDLYVKYFKKEGRAVILKTISKYNTRIKSYFVSVFLA